MSRSPSLAQRNRLTTTRAWQGQTRKGGSVADAGMSRLEFALFFHLLGALVFVAGIVVAGVVFEAARRRDDPAEIALLLGLARVGVVMVLAGATLVLAFGLWL